VDEDEEYDYDPQEEAAKPKRPAKRPATPEASRFQTIGWLVFLVAGAALCLVVAVTTSRVPVATPYLAFGGAALGAGIVGFTLHFLRSKLRVPPAAKMAALIVAALVLSLAFGGIRYTYGDRAELQASMVAAPAEVAHGTPASVSGTLTITNSGSTTARLNPHLSLSMRDPQGGPVIQHSVACPQPIPPKDAEADLIEVAPGRAYEMPFTIDIIWDGPTQSAPPCFAYIFSSAGTYNLIGTFMSAPYDAAGLPPVWTGERFGGPVSIIAH
jgi:hypothetical protein